ncbi:MAG: hypothetical protein JRJ69_14650 [Deltaproteobacteria bacterium]|nr:hypothetical protein [Deltaproteobacteria bacterium]
MVTHRERLASYNLVGRFLLFSTRWWVPRTNLSHYQNNPVVGMMSPMPITQKEIQKLKEIYLQEYDIELSDRQAWEMGIRLINLFRLLLKNSDKNRVRTSSNLPLKREG